ncbi:hypothetical protein SLS62_010715 [Diatrype stigma]|uniref:Uncharacterized protein n=1 Tax=Diatrype stigma TaxID=117547 RepID=A0AAN9UAG7_9PEZI
MVPKVRSCSVELEEPPRKGQKASSPSFPGPTKEATTTEEATTAEEATNTEGATTTEGATNAEEATTTSKKEQHDKQEKPTDDTDHAPTIAKRRPYILALPPELIIMIFEELPDIGDRSNFNKVLEACGVRGFFWG